jgi:spermidine synthase
MKGLHLTADCFECEGSTALFLNAQLLRDHVTAITQASGLTIVGEKFFPFSNPDGSPAGVTGTLLLAESHVAIHTWPERRAVTLDVYVCNFQNDNSSKARRIVDDLIQAFAPARVIRQELQRGTPESSHWHESLSAHTGYQTEVSAIQSFQSPLQRIEFAQTQDFGKVMRIDGAMMTSEKDEFCYHENLVHPAALSHPAPRRALVIGGGDGGSCEELLKHQSINSITLCEIDETVIRLSREHLPAIHRGALDDQRVSITCTDGFAFIRETQQSWDLILLDLTDPVAPDGSSLAATCMTPDFFRACNERLTDQGMLVMHLGSPYYHPERFRSTLQKLQQAFTVVRPYTVFVPLYGAQWGMAIASRNTDPCALSHTEIAQRMQQREISGLQYYHAGLHRALFALPQFAQDLIPD